MKQNASSLFQIVAELGQPLCVINRSGVILVANEEFARLLDRTRADLEGKSLSSWLSETDTAALQAQLDAPDAARVAAPIQLMSEQSSLQSVLLRVFSTGASEGEFSLVVASQIGSETLSGDVGRTLLELAAILDNASVGIVFTRNRIIQRCNNRAAEMFGYQSPDELIGKPGEIIYPDTESYERIGREAGPLLAAGRSFHADWRFRKTDGSPVWCNVYGKALDPTHTDRGTVWIIEDRTEAKRMEDALHETLRAMEAIMKNAPVTILFTRDRRIVRANTKFAQMFGFTGNEAVGQPARVLYRSDEEYEAIGRVAAPLLSQGKPFQAELFMRRQDGSDMWVNLIGYVQNLEDTREGTIWIAEDRTTQKAVDEALKRTREEIGAIFDNASVGIIFTRDRTIQRCNRRLAQIIGANDPAELIGKPASVLYPDADSYARMGQSAGPLLAAGKSFQTDWQFRRIDGSPVWCRMYATAVDPQNPNLGTVWIAEDITEARNTEAVLHRTLREMEAIMSNASVGIVFTRDRRIVRYNPRFCELYGFKGDEGYGKPARVLYRSDEEYEALGRLAAPLLSQGKPFQTELFMRRQDGTDFWVNLIGYVQNRDDPSEGTIWIGEDRSAFKRAEEELKHAYAEQQLILDNSVVGIAFIKNRIFQRCNRRLHEIYGYEPGELEGQSTRVAFLSEEIHERLGTVAYEVLGRGETFATEMIHQRRDGTPFWVRITGKAIDPADPFAGSIWNFEDISTRKMAEESLHESETLQRAILESANLIILSTDQAGCIVSCNPAAERMLGVKSSDLIGRLPTELFFDSAELESYRRRLHEETGLEPADGMAALCARPQLGQLEESEWTFRRADCGQFPVHLTISPLREAESKVKGFIFVAGDITERKRAEAAMQRSHDELEARMRERTAELEAEVIQRRRAEERLKYLALHDSLTGLPNRALLRQRISKAVDEVVAGAQLGAVLFIDLDRFKNINDTLGHHVGDALLKEVARRIASAVRAGDVVARIGGDEFVVVAGAVEEAEHAHRIAQKIHDSLQPVIRVNDHDLFATPSIGIALFPRDGSNPDALLRNADTAMYEAKAAGRNTIRFFDPAMTIAAERYLKTESSLRRAIDRSEFEPYYQPVVSLSDGALQQVELLVRWRHPELGLVLPTQFIPIAEDTGLVASIGSFVMRAACRQLRDWQARGITVPKLAVNLSAIQFRDRRLVDALTQVVEAEHVSPAQIELEITETALMQNGEQTLATLQWLAKAGFSLAVDDFGTGYSSLAYLKRFPVSKLKIDRSFIQDMTKDSDDEAIVQTIIALAKTLRLATIAEGVETTAQRDALRRFGCDFAQGFLFARPMPAPQLESLFLGHSRPRSPVDAAR